MKSIGAEFLMTGCHRWHQPNVWDAVSNGSKHYIRARNSTNTVAQLLHKTATLIYAVNCPLVASYDIPG